MGNGRRQTRRNKRDKRKPDRKTKQTSTSSSFPKVYAQVRHLKQINEKQRQELHQIMDIQDRLQRTAAEMNTLRFAVNSSLDIESLSQQLSQMPADLSCDIPQVSRQESPIRHRAKRGRFGSQQMDLLSPSRFARNENADLVNRRHETEERGKDVRSSQQGQRSSITQDEEDDPPSPLSNPLEP
jgi:hypothetical protein